NPWVSVGEASMLPPRSLTTNVLPSRTLVVLPYMLSLPPSLLFVLVVGWAPAAERGSDTNAGSLVALLCVFRPHRKLPAGEVFSWGPARSVRRLGSPPGPVPVARQHP